MELTGTTRRMNKMTNEEKTGAIVGTSSGGERVTIVESKHESIFGEDDVCCQRIIKMKCANCKKEINHNLGIDLCLDCLQGGK